MRYALACSEDTTKVTQTPASFASPAKEWMLTNDLTEIMDRSEMIFIRAKRAGRFTHDGRKGAYG
jgi:hypothetical protein